MSTELAKFNFEITSLKEAMDYAKLIADSDLVPKDYRGKAGNVLIAIQYGMEIGLKPMQAIQSIAVINGRPTIWGDAMIALVQSHQLCEYITEEIKGDTAYCTIKRKGEEEHTSKFSKNDAKVAGLLNKAGPWSQYPDRMLQLRARAFALRDKFSDVLKGISMREEVMDYEDTKVTATRVSVASENVDNLIKGKVKALTNDHVEMEKAKRFIENAKSVEDLNGIDSVVKNLTEEDKAEIRKYYKEKKIYLERQNAQVIEGENITVSAQPYNLSDMPIVGSDTGVITFSDHEKIKKSLLNAKSSETLDLAADLIVSCSPDSQPELLELYNKRKYELIK